jgi:hypothetical protein
MIVSERTLKWLMNFYPPMFFQRIWVKKFHNGFWGVDVKVNKSIFTTNLGSSIFGGTIFSASDPFYALLFGQLMQRRGLRVTVWLKSAEIQYIKPGRSDLHFTIKVREDEAAQAEKALRTEGKYVKAFPIEIFDKNGELCATVMNEIYLRNLGFFQT